MSSEFKFVKSLQWCTKLPAENYKFESPVFFLQGYECLFRFAHKKKVFIDCYIMDIEVKSEHSKWELCDVNVRVGFKEEQGFSLNEQTSTLSDDKNQQIWIMPVSYVLSKLPSDYNNGNWMKFRFSFEKTRSKMENKCLQSASYLNGEVLMESSSEDMCKLLDTGINHDVEIKCGVRSIKAHKLILCARSEVLKAMLQSNMVESQTGVIEIQDMDANYIQDFVRHLYSGKIPELTFEKAKALFEAGDKYAVRNLLFRCSEYLQDNLSSENALECLALADAHSDEQLKKSVITFSLEKRLYLQYKHWLPLCESYPKIALDIYRLSYENDI